MGSTSTFEAPGEGENWLASRYETVFADIRKDILNGVLAPGSQLLGERKMAETLGVSRETVREALRLCENAGLVVRIPTRGTFVAPPRVEQDLGHMESFTSLARRLQLNPAYTLIGLQSDDASEEIARLLAVEPGSPVLHVRAIGMGNELPMAYYESTLPGRVIDALPDNPDWASRSTYQIAAQALSTDHLEVNQDFHAVAIPRSIAQLLGVTAKTPGLMAVSVFSHESLPVEARTSWYPGSRYSFRVARTVDLTELVQ